MGRPRALVESLDPGARFRVGNWEVEPRGLLLRRNGEEVRLEPRVMGLLVCLAEHAGQPVTREELLDEVWTDVVVGDDAIHSAVSKLRRVLGTGGAADAIETVPRVGYWLRAPVEWRPPEEDAGTLSSAPLPDRAQGVEGELRRASLSGWPRIVLVAIVIAVALGALWRTGRGSGEGAGDPVSTSGAHGRMVMERIAPEARREIRPLTTWPGLEVEPAMSPVGSGERVAFSWKGLHGTNWDIWIQVLGAGDPLRLTDHEGSDHYPAWSPDGRHLAFMRFEDGDCSVLLVPALGGAERRLASCAEGESLDWSPDGNLLVWAERPSPEAPYRVVGLTLGEMTRRELTAPPPGSVGDLGPEISPDGTTLAFLRSPVLGVEDLHLLWLDAERPPRRLTQDALKIHGADWMPDGESLVYSSNRGGLFSLWQISVDGGEPRWLGASGGDLDAPTVGPSGRRVAYEQWSDDANVYGFGVDGGVGQEPIIGSTRWDWGAHVSSTGEIVFVSDRGGSSELWIQSSSGGAARRLTDLGGPYIDHPRWRPGGGAVAFGARPGGNADIYLLAVDELEPRRLTDHPAQDLAPSWSRSGSRVYFGSDRSGSWELWSVDLHGGEPEQITESGGYLGQESADGRWLYFSHRHRSGIWRQPLGEPSSAELVVADLVPMDRNHWLLAEDGLLYVRRPRHDRPILARYDLESGEVTELGDLGPLARNSGLALGADGRSILFTRYDRRESDILVLELGG